MSTHASHAHSDTLDLSITPSSHQEIDSVLARLAENKELWASAPLQNWLRCLTTCVVTLLLSARIGRSARLRPRVLWMPQ